jgi:DNA polymerase IV
MEKVDENGAVCLKEWQPEWITHILVDRSLNYEDVLKALKVEDIPDHIIVVNDNYPSDCLKFKRIVDPAQWMYEVPGQETPKTAENPQTPAGSSRPAQSESLQVKARRDVVLETPIRYQKPQPLSANHC